MAITSLKSGISTRSGMAGNGFIYPGSYESIATANPAGSTSFTFSSIPSTYSHLQIRYMGVSSYPLISTNLGAGTKSHSVYGYGSGSAGYSWDPLAGGMYVAIDGNSGNVSTGIIDILDYANTSKNKTFRALHGRETNTGDSSVHLASGFWNSTSAITSITITNNVAGSVAFGTGTTFALYGVN